MVKLSLCDYSGVYILFKGRITITIAGDDPATRKADETNKGEYLKIELIC